MIQLWYAVDFNNYSHFTLNVRKKIAPFLKSTERLYIGPAYSNGKEKKTGKNQIF